MHYYNGLSAAKRIGISYKTLLRYIEKGRIIPEQGKTPTGQLVISEDQVESLRIEVRKERDMFRRPQPDSPSSRHHETPTDTQGVPLTDTTLNEALKQIGKLQARVDVQDARIAELERRITELEAKAYPIAIEPTIIQPVTPPATDAIILQTKPSIRNVEPPTDIPPGSLLMTDFAAQYGVHRSTALRHCTQGIKGDYIEAIERTKPGGRRGDKERWLSPEQQKKAIQFWIRHNVKFTQPE